MPSASRTGRIPNTEWPAIVARRQAGETYAAIARDYDVTGPAIKYIVDKATAEGVTGAEDAAGAAPETASEAKTKTITIADLASADDPPAGGASDDGASDDGAPAEVSQAQPRQAEPESTPAPRAEPTPAITADTPLAQRLLDAANECAGLIAQAEKGAAGIDETVKAALHQVRRAVAAIEIEMNRSAAPVRAPIPQRRPSNAQEAQSGPAQGAPRARAEARDLPSNDMAADSGGFGTHIVQGTVKFFHADKGFGFVIPDGGGSDIYVPLKALRGSGLATLESEQRVRVSVTRGAKGPEAKEVEPLAA